METESSPILIIADKDSYASRGADWSVVEDYVRRGWGVPAIHEDERFPGRLFVVLEKGDAAAASAGYTEESLKRELGEPTRGGELPHGGPPRSPTSFTLFGPQLYMLWQCMPAASQDAQRGGVSAKELGRCLAVSPGAVKSFRSWFLVEVCGRHSSRLRVLDLPDSSEPGTRVLIVEKNSYANQSGRDWESIQKELASGWRIALVHRTGDFEDHTFLIMEKG